MKYRLLISALMLSGLCLSPLPGAPISPAWGFACVDCQTVGDENSDTRDLMEDEHEQTREHLIDEFDAWEEWLDTVFIDKFYPPEYVLRIAHQITTTAIYQVFAIGTLLDAKQSLESQRILQKKMTETHRDYQPSVGVCTIATNIRSLADAERRAETTTFVMSQRAQDRQMGTMHTAAAGGGESDKESRLRQFRSRYCDTRDNNAVFMNVCGSGNAGRIATLNKDIDYTRTVDALRTMNIDFSDQTLTDDEQDVLALATNLYAHEIMPRIPETEYNAGTTAGREDLLRQLLDQRQIVAKRSVAQHSYNAIVGMKSLGSPSATAGGGGGTVEEINSTDTAAYMGILLQQLGMDEEQAQEFLGERPSYYTQMEVITKKAFQQPIFYADLYDKPANVDRKKVALQAIALMQDFDTWQSYLRIESMLSVLLEIEVAKYQAATENRRARRAE